MTASFAKRKEVTDKESIRLNKGEIIAELDVVPGLWFFDCHFNGDPVMPGCLGLDALWQLVGFWLAWTGADGRGRALGVGEVKFQGQVLPDNKLVRYQVQMKRIIRRKLVMGLGDATMDVDGRTIYHATNLRVGLSPSTEGFCWLPPLKDFDGVGAPSRAGVQLKAPARRSLPQRPGRLRPGGRSHRYRLASG